MPAPDFTSFNPGYACYNNRESANIFGTEIGAC